MQTAGSLLKSRRVQTKLTLTQVSHLTKIPVKTLLALEKDRFDQLPAAPYIQGFIQNYAQALKLDPQSVIAVFKRGYNRKLQKKLVPSGFIKPLNPRVNPRLLAATAVILTPLVYLGLIVYNLFQPPKLLINEPQEGQEVRTPVLIKGKTDRDATLTLNNQTVNLEPDGSFTTISSSPELRFKATSRRGKVRELVRYVIIRE